MRQPAYKHFTIVRPLFDIPLLGGQARIAQLDVHDLAVDFVRASSYGALRRLILFVGDEAEASGVARFRILHHYRVDYLAVFGEFAVEHFFGCVPCQPTDEYFALN